MDPSIEFIERASALKHDLGKYVAWLTANLDEASWQPPLSDDLVEGLRSDILETRRGRSGSEAAWEVWERLRPSDVLVQENEELQLVERAVAVLQSAEGALRGPDHSELANLASAIRQAQAEIRTQLLRLHRRLAK